MDVTLMKLRAYVSFASTVGLTAALAMAASGCKTGNPAQPSTAGSIVAPAPVSPAAGATISYFSLPAKLTVSNATVTTGAAPTYTFEVAYDAGFSSKVATVSGVSQGSNGQTTATVSSLLPNNTYYWHARADLGSTSGSFSSTYSFAVGGQVTLSTPVAVSPVSGAFVSGQGVLTVTNATKTGPAGPITYKFEVSDTAAFTSILASGTAPEGPNQTSYTLTQTLATGKTYYWRATATDATNGVTGSPSVAATFAEITSVQSLLATEEGFTLWSGVQPPGQPGQAKLGNNWDVQNVVTNGVSYVSPQLEALQVFDLLDRGFAPQDAINWMKANGYPSTDPTVVNEGGGVTAIGFTLYYMANTNGPWDLIISGTRG
jgi:hypothetical protein